jgi:hypothetical protein
MQEGMKRSVYDRDHRVKVGAPHWQSPAVKDCAGGQVVFWAEIEYRFSARFFDANLEEVL